MNGYDAKQLKPGDTVVFPDGLKMKVRKVENDQKQPKTILVNGVPSTQLKLWGAKKTRN